MSHPAPGNPTPTPTKTRALAPDLARGFMLLLIGIAYTAIYLPVSASGVAPDASGAVDRITNFLRTLLVNERSYTMFTALFGYGLVMITRKLHRAGTPEKKARGILRRRGLFLLLFGFLHGALVFSGEILGTYGLASVILAGLVLRSDRALRLAIILFLSIQGVLLALLWTGTYATGDMQDSMDFSGSIPDSYLESIAVRAAEWPFSPIFVLLMYPVIPVLLIGVWAGRRRLLEDVAGNRPLLVRAAVVGTAISIAGALALALQAGGYIDLAPMPLGIAAAAHNLTGMAGGLAYLAIFALLGDGLQSSPGPIARAVVATGQRSLTAYLVMSALIATVSAPWGLDVGSRAGSLASVGVALGCWGVAVVLSVVLASAGRAGPADALLRRLAYPKNNDSA